MTYYVAKNIIGKKELNFSRTVLIEGGERGHIILLHTYTTTSNERRKKLSNKHKVELEHQLINCINI